MKDRFEEEEELVGTWSVSLQLLEGMIYALTSFSSNYAGFSPPVYLCGF